MQVIKAIVQTVFKQLSNPEVEVKSRLIQQWPDIAGPKIAPHTKPTLSRDGRLCVWVDQSTLAFELNQRYREAFLKRVQNVLGEKAVHAIYFRVGQLR